MAVDLQTYRTDQDISDIRHEMAHLRGVVEQLVQRISGIEARMGGLETRLDSGLKWVAGLVLTSWLTLAGLIIGLSLQGH